MRALQLGDTDDDNLVLEEISHHHVGPLFAAGFRKYNIVRIPEKVSFLKWYHYTPLNAENFASGRHTTSN